MFKHNKLGTKGEQIANNYLLNKGYKILNRNWRAGKKEIDIIAEKNLILVFFEIKTRTGYDFGFPEESVNKKKQNFIKSAAETYIFQNPNYNIIQFDIISIILEGDIVKELIHFEEAFY